MAAKAVQAKTLTQRGRYWVKHLRQWLQSGQSQAQYCRQHHLSVSALRWWRRQLPRDLWANDPPDGPPSHPETFVELSIAPGPEGIYEIRLHGGRSLHLGSRFDPDQVRQLVQVLEPPC